MTSEGHSPFWVGSFLGQEVHLNTLIMLWAAMVVVLLFARLSTLSLRVQPGKLQFFAEGIVNFVRGITTAAAGDRGDRFLFYAGSMFLLVLVCNLMGQLPLRLLHLPQGELIAATGDINTPLAFGLMTFCFYLVFGIITKGPGAYFGHYGEPSPLMAPLHLLEDFTRPATLTFRLFMNIFIGEVLALVAMTITPVGLPAAVIFLELFVAVLQAFIFTILSSVYIGAMSESHDHGHEHEADHGHGHQALAGHAMV